MDKFFTRVSVFVGYPVVMALAVLVEVISTVYYCFINEIKYLPRHILENIRKTHKTAKEVWFWYDENQRD